MPEFLFNKDKKKEKRSNVQKKSHGNFAMKPLPKIFLKLKKWKGREKVEHGEGWSIKFEFT